jgi:hypothetical protein
MLATARILGGVAITITVLGVCAGATDAGKACERVNTNVRRVTGQ